MKGLVPRKATPSFFRVYMHRQVPPTRGCIRHTPKQRVVCALEIAYLSGDTCYRREPVRVKLSSAVSGGGHGPAILDTRPAAVVGLGNASHEGLA